MTPYIHVNRDGSVDIVGSPENLEALGHALIMKAKLGDRFCFTMDDRVNPVIQILVFPDSE